MICSKQRKGGNDVQHKHSSKSDAVTIQRQDSVVPWLVVSAQTAGPRGSEPFFGISCESEFSLVRIFQTYSNKSTGFPQIHLSGICFYNTLLTLSLHLN